MANPVQGSFAETTRLSAILVPFPSNTGVNLTNVSWEYLHTVHFLKNTEQRCFLLVSSAALFLLPIFEVRWTLSLDPAFR